MLELLANDALFIALFIGASSTFIVIIKIIKAHALTMYIWQDKIAYNFRDHYKILKNIRITDDKYYS